MGSYKCLKLLCYLIFFPFWPIYFLYKWCKRKRSGPCCPETDCFDVYRPRPRRERTKVKIEHTQASEGFLTIMHDFFACFNQWCCFAFTFTKNLRLVDAVSRYQEVLPPNTQTMIKELLENEYISLVLEYLNTRQPKFYFRVLPTGSIRERFGYKVPSTSVLATDYDLMLVPDSIYVYDSFTSRDDNFPTCFVAVDDPNQNPERPKGYLWLELKENLQVWNSLCFERLTHDGVKLYLSQLAVLNLIRNEIGNQDFTSALRTISILLEKEAVGVNAKRTGPALNITLSRDTKPKELLNVDFTIALTCPIFPRDGKYFFERREDNENIHWPDENILKKILKLGCHVVPKPSKKTLTSLQEEQIENSYLGNSAVLEWRYSFSQAELLLSDNIFEVARVAYLAFKATIKAHINHVADHEGKFHSIPSYALKTICFYEVESKPTEYWAGENVSVDFLRVLMESLYRRVQARHCPHYWIKGLNLFEEMEATDFQFFEFHLQAIVESDYVKYVASEWLEWNRYVRNNCCNSCMTQGGEERIIIERPDEIEPNICRCFMFRCSSDRKSPDDCCIFGPMEYNSIAMEVY